MANTKLLLETLRLADGGRVVCAVQTPDGVVRQSVIAPSFFEEFQATVPANRAAEATHTRQLRIVNDNVSYLEGEAERLWQQGQSELLIR
jgi:hypothetical protein